MGLAGKNELKEREERREKKEGDRMTYQIVNCGGEREGEVGYQTTGEERKEERKIGEERKKMLWDEIRD